MLAWRAGGNGDEARKAAVQYAGLGEDNRKLMVEVLSNTLADPAAKPTTDEEMSAFTKAVDDLKSQDGAQALQIYASNRKDAAGVKQWSDKYNEWRADEIDAKRSVEEAATYGWQLFHDKNVAAAETWFRKSADWQPNEPAAIGLVLAAHALRHDKDYAARVAEFGKTFPAIAKIAAATHGSFVPSRRIKVAVSCRGGGRSCVGKPAKRGGGAAPGQWDQGADQIVSAYKNGQYDSAVAMLDQRRAKGAEPRGLSVIRGWAMFQKGDWDGAKQVFTNLDRGAYSREREEGLRVIEMSYTPSRFR